ncbi:hypothetical protein GCM10010399_14230 [Dactylosporangium fulvum]|uniref:Uncharacterized protein n=1 Tax=Dactylosporangium fulvum TaxID=53359 RepID=A0ABY5W7D2_9ACTN|nr:hypothetical protein [Dactylosporangium fulvum]UWP85159.1 hypothetical protein Dfulv_13385 [Dactylosporangium fulvum]
MRRLADSLDDIADQAKLYDVTDAAIRGARRRRRARAFERTALTVLVVVVLTGFTYSLLSFGGGRPGGGPGRQDGDPPAVVRLLLDSPTRGSLAGDTAYLGAVLDRIVDDPDSFGLPGDRARLRVLFAGDLPGGHRLVIVAGVTAAPLMINLTGKAGTPATRLKLVSWGDLEDPVVDGSSHAGPGEAGYVLLFGPDGYDVSVSSEPRYLADGTVQRSWAPEPAGYLVRDTTAMPRGLRVRMSRGDTVLYERAVPSYGRKAGTVDPNPLHGRGRPAPRAVQTAADALAYSTGLVGPEVHYVVLWSDNFPVEDPNGGGSGTGQIATVMAVTPDGGGPYITIATDTNQPPTARDHPTGTGVFGDPERALVVMRLPHWTQEMPDTIQIVAPPAAVRVDLLRAGAVVASTPLVNGVGRLDLAGPVELTVRAYDAQGAVVAERPFADVTVLPAGGYEPAIRGW